MAKYDYALFDFDGTIYNTYDGIVNCYSNALRQLYGDRYADFDLSLCIGPPLPDSFSRVIGIPGEDVEQAIELFRERYRSKGVHECEIYPGITDMISRLRAAGVTPAVASSKTQEIIVATLKNNGQSELFDCVSGLSSDSSRSTKADAINTVLDRCGITDRSRAVMIGDRFYDAEGAAETHVDFIAAMYGFGKKEEFEPYPCVFFSNSPAETADFIIG